MDLKDHSNQSTIIFMQENQFQNVYKTKAILLMC